MKRVLTDEHLEQLGKTFVYHTFGEAKEKGNGDHNPRLPFELYVEAWMNGKDITEILSSLQNYHQPQARSADFIIVPEKPRTTA